VRPARAIAAIAAIAAAGLALAAGEAHAASAKWSQEANVKDAAARLAKLQRSGGAEGVVKFIDACYRTHMLAEAFTQGLEACMAQDYMHSKVLAMIYARLPAEQRAKRGLPEPEAIARVMGQRFSAVFSQYKLSSADADALKKAVDQHGFPIFLQAVFPDSGAADPKPN
jgi:hypothetical protein